MHELKYFKECSLFNSGYAYADGYSQAVCACGWESAASKDEKILVVLYRLHLEGLNPTAGVERQIVETTTCVPVKRDK
jgi:hypothetical protein